MSLQRIKWGRSMLAVLALCGVAVADVPVGEFVDAQPVPGIDRAFDNRGPSISADGLTLFFHSDRTGQNDLYQATRDSELDPFADTVNLGSVVNSPQLDGAPSISPDGLALYFHSKRLGGRGQADLYKATRADTKSDFDNVVSLGINSNAEDRQPGISSDGLTMFFRSERGGNSDIYQATRTHPDDTFGDAERLPISTGGFEGYPDISADGLTLFYSVCDANRACDLWVANRDMIDQPFSSAMNLATLWPGVNTGPFQWHPNISSDWPAVGSKFYFNTFNGRPEIWEATWVPELPYDLDGDNVIDIRDVELLSQKIQAGSESLWFDLNEDDEVGVEDLSLLIKDESSINSWIGDANLDGEFNTGDLVDVFSCRPIRGRIRPK